MAVAAGFGRGSVAAVSTDLLHKTKSNYKLSSLHHSVGVTSCGVIGRKDKGDESLTYGLVCLVHKRDVHTKKDKYYNNNVSIHTCVR